MLSLLLQNENIRHFLQHFKKERPEEPVMDAELHRLLRETKAEIAACRNNLALTEDETLIDMYIYAIKASEMRFAHLLKLAKHEEAAS